MSKLSVAFLTQDFQGPQTYSINYYIAILLYFFKHRFHHIKAVVYSHRVDPYPPRSFVEIMADHNISEYPQHVKLITFDCLKLNTAEFLKDFDLVICTMYWWGDILKNLVTCYRDKPKIVYWIPSIMLHEFIMAKQEPWERLDLMVDYQKMCILYADHLIFNSQAELVRAYTYYGQIIKSKSSVIYPVTINAAKHQTNLLSKTSSIRFSYLGRWDYRKGIHLVIEAFFRFYSKHRNALLYIISDFLDHNLSLDSVLDTKCKQKLIILYNTGAIQFLHWQSARSEYLKLLRDCNVVIIPSLYDPFNMVAYDSICMGIPTILSRFCGVEEIVTDTTDWILKINPWDLEEFDNAMSHMMAICNSQSSTKCPDNLPLSYTLEHMIDDTFTVFQSMLNL